jgi:hypothetical protein
MRGLPTTRAGELVLVAILFDLLHDHAPTSQGLRVLTGLGDAVEPTLTELAHVGAIVRDGKGTIVAAYPLSAIPTSHRIELDSLHPWANCAFDALAVPKMVGQNGVVQSRCGHCGAPTRIVVGGETVHESHPPGVIVSYGGLANCGDKSSLEVSCPFINFFCSAQHAEAWARPDGWVGQFLPLHEAVALAVDRFHFIIELYQRHTLALQR